jgi:hypothetical protein
MAAAERPRWLRILLAVLYELRPFTLPTRHDLITWVQWSRSTAVILYREGREALVLLKAGATTVLKDMTWRQAGIVTVWIALLWLALRVEFALAYLILSALTTIFTVVRGEPAFLFQGV